MSTRWIVSLTLAVLVGGGVTAGSMLASGYRKVEGSPASPPDCTPVACEPVECIPAAAPETAPETEVETEVEAGTVDEVPVEPRPRRRRRRRGPSEVLNPWDTAAPANTDTTDTDTSDTDTPPDQAPADGPASMSSARRPVLNDWD